jgi:membrane protein involved in colicin uptake
MSAEKSTERPWWQEGIPAAVFGLIATVGAAGITAIHDGYQKERDLQLQQQQEVEHLRTTYAAVLADGGVEQVALLADFIASTENDPTIRDWATKQKAVAQKKIDDLQKQLANAQTAAASAEAARLKAEGDAAIALQAAQRAKAETARTAQAELVEAQRKVAEANTKAESARQLVDNSSMRLNGQRISATQQVSGVNRAAMMTYIPPKFGP